MNPRKVKTDFFFELLFRGICPGRTEEFAAKHLLDPGVCRGAR